MENITIVELAEKWMDGKLSESDRATIDHRLKTDPEFKQAFTESITLISTLHKQAELSAFRKLLKSCSSSAIQGNFSTQAKIFQFWVKNKKTIAVAASIAIVVSVGLSTAIQQFNPEKNKHLRPLVEKLKEQDVKYRTLEREIGKIKNDSDPSSAKNTKLESTFRATGFLIDATNNYLITNAHVIREANHQLVVENNEGEQFNAEVAFIHHDHDLAILHIKDPNFKTLAPIPFNLKKETAELGESIFTLGFPKQEIVYGEGYISAINGFEMDPVFYQLNTLTKDGHSGSPVISKQGELIGVISSKETSGEGVAFAIKSQYIWDAFEEMKKTSFPEAKISARQPFLKGDRKAQIKKVQDYIFMIKGN